MNYELIYMIIRTARTWMDAYRDTKKLLELIGLIANFTDLDAEL